MTAEQHRQKRDLYKQELVMARPTDLPIPQMHTDFDYRFEMTRLYQQRQWYQWTMGLAWFNRQVERIIQDWNSGSFFNQDEDYAETRRVFEETEKDITQFLHQQGGRLRDDT